MDSVLWGIMLLSVIIPVYNEEQHIMKVIERVNEVAIEKEIIIVNDGSNDKTREILETAMFYHCRIVHHASNRGKGASIRTALPLVKGDVVIIQDADLELNPAEFSKLLEPISSGKAMVVFGSRYLGEGKVGDLARYMANKFLTLLINFLYHTSLSDINTCYKMFSASLIPSLDLKSNGFDIEPEMVAKLLRHGGQIYEVPISYMPRSVKEGKKIRAFDFIKDVIAIFKYRK